jgi:hypothetical protein
VQEFYCTLFHQLFKVSTFQLLPNGSMSTIRDGEVLM